MSTSTQTVSITDTAGNTYAEAIGQAQDADKYEKLAAAWKQPEQKLRGRVPELSTAWGLANEHDAFSAENLRLA